MRVKKVVRKKGGHTEESMKAALELVKSGVSIRQSSKVCQLSYATVRRYVQLSKVSAEGTIRLTPNYEINAVFSTVEELSLKAYIEHCAQLFYGLTSKDCRRVAFQLAKRNNKKIPPSWIATEMAGIEWLRSFKRRHPDISLRKPEACSLARATSFNKHNVQIFFNNLKSALERNACFADGTRLYNLDETATTTVQRPGKVMARKGTNVGKITSGERGTLVTTCCIVSATGQALPPALVFPRKKFQPHMLIGAPAGSLGLAASSGWMNAEIFVDVMKHFIKHVSASKENPALLIMDNHESHLSIAALDLAKSSGVTVLTLHPHTTAKLQPLDVGLNGPFKTYYNAAVDSWLLRNPGRPMTIYNIAECVGPAYLKAMNPINIVNAFKKCGIFPFDDSIFTEEDFLPSTVTDRSYIPPVNLTEENAIEIENIPPGISDLDDSFLNYFDEDVTPEIADISPSVIENVVLDLVEIDRQNIDSKPIPSTSKDDISIHPNNVTPPKDASNLPPPSQYLKQVENNCQNINMQPNPSTSQFISPFQFMPPLRSTPRNTKRRRTLGKSMIATDTPEKNAITEKKKLKINKLPKNVKKDLFTEDKIKKKTNKKKAIINENNETSDEEDFVASGSSSGGDDFISRSEDEDVITVLDGNFIPLTRDPKEEEFVIVSFPLKKSNVYYIAKILEVIDDNDDDSDFFVSFLRLKNKLSLKFCEPVVPDTAGIQIKDIKYILPKPNIVGSSRRQASFSFDVDMSQLKLR